ncbi:MAG: ArsA family ATPase, partial [Gemmatimonadota bacterium]
LMATWIGGLAQRRKKVSALARMWRNVAGSEAAAEGGDEDPVLAALEERRTRFLRTRHALTDPERTAFVFVVIPERLPILETEKAVRTLAKYGIPIGALVVNQVLPLPEEERHGEAGAGDRASGGGADAVFLAGRRARQAGYLARIARGSGDWPVLHLSLQASDPVGVEALRELGAAIHPAPSAWTDRAESGQ